MWDIGREAGAVPGPILDHGVRGSFSTGAPLVGKKTENYFLLLIYFVAFFEQSPGACSVAGPVLGTVLPVPLELWAGGDRRKDTERQRCVARVSADQRQGWGGGGGELCLLSNKVKAS